MDSRGEDDCGDITHEASAVAASSNERGESRSRSTAMEEKVCEAYVTLGRLNQIKMRHQRDAKWLRDHLEERVKLAYESATRRVRGEYESLQANLQKLYCKSVADLDAHRLQVEDPTRRCLEGLGEQMGKLKQAENDLKAVLGDPEEERFMRDISAVMDEVNDVLAASADLEKIPHPKATRLTASDFPVGRLHNVVIAPKRSGDRSRINTNSTTVKPPGHGVAATISGNSSATRSAVVESSMRWVPVLVAAVPPANAVASAEWEVEEGGPKAGTAGGDDAAGSGSNEDLGGQSVDGESGGQRSQGPLGAGGGGKPGVRETAEACGHCACACRRDDVWAAYRTLRTRYRALKETADQEELRGRVEECRRKLQAEFDQKRREMEGELRKAQEEICTLHGVAQDAAAECKARQRDAIVMRDEVLRAQRGLEEALRDALAAREEVNRRKQHGEVLLARLRFLQGQTAACVGTVGLGNPAAAAFELDDDFDSQMEDDYSSNQHDHRQGPRSGAGYTSPPNTRFDGNSNGPKGRTSDRYGRGDSSDTDDGESMDLTGEWEDGGTSYRGDRRAMRDAREAETWALERERRQLSRELRRLNAQLSRSASVGTSEGSDEDLSDSCDSDYGTRRQVARSRTRSHSGRSQDDIRREHSKSRAEYRGASRGQQHDNGTSMRNGIETHGASGQLGDNGTARRAHRERERVPYCDDASSYPLSLNLESDSQDYLSDSPVGGADGLKSLADAHDTTAVSAANLAALDVAVASDRRRSGTTDNQRTSTSSNDAGRTPHEESRQEQWSVDDDKNDLRLSFPLSDGTEQEGGVPIGGGGHGIRTEGRAKGGGVVPKQDTGGRLKKHSACFTRSSNTGAGSIDGATEPTGRAWAPRRRRKERGGGGEEDRGGRAGNQPSSSSIRGSHAGSTDGASTSGRSDHRSTESSRSDTI